MQTISPAGKYKKADHRQPAKSHLAPVFVLLVLAPAIAELLLGDIGLSPALPLLFLLNLAYYGTGAVAIREIVRRRGLPWFWVPILAFAYGLIEEGLVLHSLFNPHFPGIGFLGFYGRGLGVDWVWSSFVLGLHTAWSISTPILLTELLFPTYRHERWLRDVGFAINCVIFVLAMLLLAFIYATRVTPGFQPAPLATLCTALLILALLALTLFIPIKVDVEIPESSLQPVPTPWIVGGVTFLLGIVFLFTHEFYTPAFPAWLAFLLNLVVALVSIVLLVRWTGVNRRWQDTHGVALAFAAILGYCCIGFAVARSNVTNIIFHGVLVVITLVLMVLLTLKVRARVEDATTDVAQL